MNIVIVEELPRKKLPHFPVQHPGWWIAVWWIALVLLLLLLLVLLFLKPQQEYSVTIVSRVSHSEGTGSTAKLASPTEQEEKYRPGEITVWYGTDRKLVDPNDESNGYSQERDTIIHYGQCLVAIPEAARRLGSTGSSFWKRLFKGDDRLRLVEITPLSNYSFWTNIKATLTANVSNERVALVYIHGFANSFADSAIRAAQLTADLDIKGVTAFFSWPSFGSLTDYLYDGVSIRLSEDHIAHFLVRMAQDVGADRVHIIAHSMGNRGLLHALYSAIYKAELEGVRFGEIILAAPDVDVDEFLRYAPIYPSKSVRTTMYAGKGDLPLNLSTILHRSPRAGYIPPVTVVTGIDTVDVSNIELDRLGHGYYAEARPVISDIHQLFEKDEPPPTRWPPMTRRTTQDGLIYWILK